jgi:hypothetical protein
LRGFLPFALSTRFCYNKSSVQRPQKLVAWFIPQFRQTAMSRPNASILAGQSRLPSPRNCHLAAKLNLHSAVLVSLLWLLPFCSDQTLWAEETATQTSDTSAAAVHFDQHIAPLLARRCLGCHNASDRKGELDLASHATAMKGGESGAVLVPGNLEESLLWTHVRDGVMPPKEPLPAAERELLKAWVTAGAAWGSDPIDPFRFTSDARAGYDWWALQPLRAVTPPTTPKEAIVHNPIDNFILAELAKKNLAPNPPADRQTFLRRVTFDLTGLPPTPKEMDRFVQSDLKDPDNYERVIGGLLASPHYGERWARHWLDIVRFGESNGFERDHIRPNAWPYRDWVIEAFNADMPYDEFCRRQLAGDVLYPQDPSAIIATGFLSAGPLDDVGKKQQSVAMKAVVRQDELEEVVSAVGQTFLGLTVNCARCHDHKFDPIRQREYYQLCAALAGVEHGERQLSIPDSATKIEQLTQRISSIESGIAFYERPTRNILLAEAKQKNNDEKPVAPQPLLAWDFTADLTSTDKSLASTAQGEPVRDVEGLHLDGRASLVLSAPLQQPLRAKTLAAWVKISDLKQSGGGVIGVQTLDGSVFDAIVFGERDPSQWMAGSNGFVRTQSFAGMAEDAADKSYVHFAIVYDEDGTITGYRQGLPYGKPYKSTGPVTFEAGKAQISFGVRHTPAGGNRMLSGILQRAALFDRALSASEIAALAGVVDQMEISEAQLRSRMPAAEFEQRQKLLEFLQADRSQLNQLKTKTTYAVAPQQPPLTHLLNRGNPGEPQEVLPPGGVASVQGVNADFALPVDAPDDVRRQKLAAWITSEQNPLFARVMMNRLWHYHFGVGIVDTPSDLGFNGGRPTHPELLDWLAMEFIRSGWSIKHMQKLIVQSATYQQSSTVQDNARQTDADNRLLWRKSRQRLDAETMRDAILSIAGEFNPQMGGPGYQDFTTYVHNSQFYFPVDPEGPEYNRRSIYRTWIRSGRNRLLDTFDCPDPSTKTPVRANTTTPLQSLVLLNNSFVLRMANKCAARLESEAGSESAEQVKRLFQLAYGRSPDAEELSAATGFVSENGLPALCRVVFNSNEFLYID